VATSREAPAFGPFHRRAIDQEEIDKICASGQIWGRAPRNIYASAYPAVKAWPGPLPEGRPGVEFYTTVAPDQDKAPSSPQWTEGNPGVIILERNELVAIEVTITKRIDWS